MKIKTATDGIRYALLPLGLVQHLLDQLMLLDVPAQLEAEVLGGMFPVVVFPNSSSPALHSIMAEYLASNGYVVAGFVPKGRFSSGMEFSGVGLETAVIDLEFVLNKISELPYVNMNQVTLGGNAIYSSVSAAVVQLQNYALFVPPTKHRSQMLAECSRQSPLPPR